MMEQTQPQILLEVQEVEEKVLLDQFMLDILEEQEELDLKLQ